MKVIGYIVITLIASAIGSIWSGYALTVLWGWFIVPAFDLAQIAITTAIGINVIITLLTVKLMDNAKQEKEYGELLFEGFIKSLIIPAMSLLTGWVVTLFM
jgi:hypothetical protein